MKIDRRNPMHWLYLARFGAAVLAALVLRAFRRRNTKPRVVLYGHRLGGNLLAIYRALRAEHRDAFEVSFLALDPEHARTLEQDGEAVVRATSIECARLLSRADAMITDHGLHAMLPLLWWSDLRFFDVWHGIAFKGFDADDFRVQHRYDEIWVASPLQRKLYVERYGFDPDRVHATGYARTDRLVRRQEDPAALRRAFGLPGDGPVVLFAPTWKQDSVGRSLYPFGLGEAEFMGALSGLAKHAGATVVMRAHLNSGGAGGAAYPNVVQVPYAEYPDTEGLLLVSDVLVCDWSSIAFDYLLLDRPTIFLDVEPPFRKGFSLGPEYRFGTVVMDASTLRHALAAALRDVEGGAGAGRYYDMRDKVYANCADGSAAASCIRRLRLSLEDGSFR